MNRSVIRQVFLRLETLSASVADVLLFVVVCGGVVLEVAFDSESCRTEITLETPLTEVNGLFVSAHGLL